VAVKRGLVCPYCGACQAVEHGVVRRLCGSDTERASARVLAGTRVLACGSAYKSVTAVAVHAPVQPEHSILVRAEIRLLFCGAHSLLYRKLDF